MIEAARLRPNGLLLLTISSLLLGASQTRADSQSATATQANDIWRRGLELATSGGFGEAVDVLRQIPKGGVLTDKVRGWLEEYESKQARRREMNQADYVKYVAYAKERIDRKEYAYALDQTLLAHDVAADRDAFLNEPWLQQLVVEALTKADELRRDADWKGAWHIYADLASLFEFEPRYQKLEREVLTHLRFDSMFSPESNWKERIERAKWEDAEAALECIQLYYVEPANFKTLTESGLEHLLLLAESTSARVLFDGLKNNADRADFVARVKANLMQVHESPSLDRKSAVRVFRRVINDINRQTIRLPDELLVSELLRGALEPLDEFTTIIWPQEADEFDKHTRGDFIGVGISIVKNRVTDEIEVVSPLEDTPAYRAGIQAGDIITHVNGESLKGFSINKVVDTITGPKDSLVTLSLRRDEKVLEFPLRRAVVKIQSVKGLRRDPVNEERWSYWLDDDLGIAYLRITNFQRNTVEDVKNIFSELAPKNLRGVILDLRGNPGGLLDSAWQMSSLFLHDGDNVVSTRGRDPTENATLDAQGDGPWSNLPTTVLVDENSASASEIVAGAIQDHEHGQVVGARTFGKFSVQNLINLSRSNAKLKITTARYYLPNGRSLHREPTSHQWGVEPDIKVRLVRKERLVLYQMRREADLLGPPKPQGKGDADDLNDLSLTDDPELDETELKKEPDGTVKEPDGTVKEPDGTVKEPGEQPAAESVEPSPESGDSTAVADAERQEALPKLHQPDENDRPKEDPQLDAALLEMRIRLLADSHPTLAVADERMKEDQTAKP